jgi:predicted GNAT superfamily acetyltransferase
MSNRQIYVQTVLNLYARTPDIACGVGRSDRLLANWFFDRHIPIDIVEAALLLGTARRRGQRGKLTLEAIRSLHYFEPIVDELAAQPLPRGYLEYLRMKVKPSMQEVPF